MVSDAVRDALAEDAEDVDGFEERRDEPAVSFDSFVKSLKRRGR